MVEEIYIKQRMAGNIMKVVLKGYRLNLKPNYRFYTVLQKSLQVLTGKGAIILTLS